MYFLSPPMCMYSTTCFMSGSRITLFMTCCLPLKYPDLQPAASRWNVSSSSRNSLTCQHWLWSPEWCLTHRIFPINILWINKLIMNTWFSHRSIKKTFIFIIKPVLVFLSALKLFAYKVFMNIKNIYTLNWFPFNYK